CACVSTTARTSAWRSTRYVKSGSTRSTPRCSSRGKARPASTTSVPWSCSNTVMFFPTSPRPPSGMTRRRSVTRRVYPRAAAALRRGGDAQAGPREAVAHLLELVVGGRDHRQAEAADVLADERERGLDRNRVDRDGVELPQRRERLVDLARSVDVAGAVPAHQLLHLRAGDVRADADAAGAPEAEKRQQERIVAGVQVEAELDDPAG